MLGEKKKKGEKRKLAMKLFLIIMFLLIYNITQVYANPVLVYYDFFAVYISLIYFFLILPILLVITIAVEYKIIRLFLKDIINNQSKFLISVIFVNLCTFSITQIITFIIIYKFRFPLWNYLLIELIPITLEFLLYLQIFKIFSHNNVFFLSIRNKITLLSTVTANLVTFIIGTFISFPIARLFFF